MQAGSLETTTGLLVFEVKVYFPTTQVLVLVLKPCF